ncbi:hypothetical protein [uncultured Lactobacillus sp.]|uniref:hypothetical protein n=1 Tax=uncultured Lactobacillus sp. TaxID=153152 RepID=UPI00260443D4|nr:hypothetical protein [uncultured Lactobacillus sp.]
MSYSITLVSEARDHHELSDAWVHCSWNYRELFEHLPCGWVRDWQGKMAKDLLDPVEASLYLLRRDKYVDARYYLKYIADYPDSTLENAQYILSETIGMFKRHPNGIVNLD